MCPCQCCNYLVRGERTGRLAHHITPRIANTMGPPGVWGIWGEWLSFFRDLGSTGNYFRGAGEQAHSFGDLGSPAKKQKIKEISI